jgi:hypothetical protein
VGGCGKCGQVHDPKRCAGHANVRADPGDRDSRIVGQRPCKQYPLHGSKVCAAHGGSAPNPKAKAAKRAAEQKARTVLETYGRKVDTDPVEALLDEVRWTAGHVAWLRERVQEIEQGQLAWGKTKTEAHKATEFPGTNTTEQAVPNVWLVLYQQERKHLVDVCKAAIAAKIDERRVRLAEQQGEILIGVIQAILADLKLSPEQNSRVPEIVPRHLRLIADGQAA